MGMAPAELLKLSESLSVKAHNSIDIGYLKTVLFPELYNADIPQPMSTQSYSRFSDKKEITLSTGQDGSGLFIWYPKTNMGPQIFFQDG